ncbi:unnamed protein product [Trichogramma brassicae]|uniref:Uncharacterized protein n=1 Tax=Trichogramma brassicae TaxID=86971 RepID=A0A6H5IF62_9HYME|nr:unnamed protein product [Trichogramma brassicae]
MAEHNLTEHPFHTGYASSPSSTSSSDSEYQGRRQVKRSRDRITPERPRSFELSPRRGSSTSTVDSYLANSSSSSSSSYTDASSSDSSPSNAPGGAEHTLVNDQSDETATRDQLGIALRSARHTLVNDLHGATAANVRQDIALKSAEHALASDLQCERATRRSNLVSTFALADVSSALSSFTLSDFASQSFPGLRTEDRSRERVLRFLARCLGERSRLSRRADRSLECALRFLARCLVDLLLQSRRIDHSREYALRLLAHCLGELSELLASVYEEELELLEFARYESTVEVELPRRGLSSNDLGLSGVIRSLLRLTWRRPWYSLSDEEVEDVSSVSVPQPLCLCLCATTPPVVHHLNNTDQIRFASVMPLNDLDRSRRVERRCVSQRGARNRTFNCSYSKNSITRKNSSTRKNSNTRKKREYPRKLEYSKNRVLDSNSRKKLELDESSFFEYSHSPTYHICCTLRNFAAIKTNDTRKTRLLEKIRVPEKTLILEKNASTRENWSTQKIEYSTRTRGKNSNSTSRVFSSTRTALLTISGL